MKTLAELKRDAKAQKISLELMPVGIWKDGVADRVKGIRKVVSANSVGITLERADGKGRSECGIERAALIEYTDNSLKVFKPGYREPTLEEKRVLEEWDKIASTQEYQDRAWADAMTDCSCTFYEKKYFFTERNMEHLLGYETKHGCCLDFNLKNGGESKYIRDDKIKCELELEYKVYHN